MRLTIFCSHSDHIEHLEAENLWLKMQMIHERQRAERAIDTLLGLKLGVAPITVPTREELLQTESEVEKTLRNPEFTQAGEV
jgi:hypothetical protein